MFTFSYRTIARIGCEESPQFSLSKSPYSSWQWHWKNGKENSLPTIETLKGPFELTQCPSRFLDSGAPLAPLHGPLIDLPSSHVIDFLSMMIKTMKY